MPAVSNDVVLPGDVPPEAVAGTAHEVEARAAIERAIGAAAPASAHGAT